METFEVITPNSVEFLYTSDWHLTDNPPGRRTKTYAQDIRDKVSFVSALAHKSGAVMLCGGDVFHIKDPDSSANSFSLVNSVISLMKAMPYNRIFGDHGNHDLFNDRFDSLPTQPLGALLAAGVYHDLSVEPVIFHSANRKVSVSVEAYPYADDMVTLERVLKAPPRPIVYCGECAGAGCDACVDGKVPVPFRVAILHQYGHPGNQGTMFGNHPTIGYNQLADCDYDIMLWGHDHSREETVTVGNVTHIRLGSLARAAWSGDEADRKVSAASLKFTESGVKYKEVPIPVKPIEVIFVTADVVTHKLADSTEVTDFFNEMDSSIAEVETTDPTVVVKALCKDEKEVEDCVLEVCEF